MPLFRNDGHLPISQREIVLQEHLSVPSTQTLARHLLETTKRPMPAFVIAAREQTGGRGRRGNEWSSPRGGSYQTIVLQDNEQRLRSASITLLIGSYIAKALRQEFELDVMLKWPNDLFLYGKKLAGILTEWTKGHLLVGVGVNAMSCPHLRGATLDVSAEQLPRVSELVRCAVFTATSRAWEGYGFTAQDVTDIDFLRDRHIAVNLFQSGSGVLHGVATGIDDSGRLLVTDVHGTEHRILNGSIVQY